MGLWHILVLLILANPVPTVLRLAKTWRTGRSSPKLSRIAFALSAASVINSIKSFRVS